MLTYKYPSDATLSSSLYVCCLSVEKIRIYSGLDIGLAKKKSLRSQLIKRAPSLVSDITLFNQSFVSRRDAVGAPMS